MRIRKVKNKDKMYDSNLIIFNPENYKNNWNKFFNNSNPIYLEIGMGKGNFIIENALRYPNINFIGLERFDDIIYKAFIKLESKLPNLIFIKGDADNLLDYFSNEINLLYLNFSDPWPKNKHEKRRLTSNKYLEYYNEILNDNHIIFKTDNRKLFEYSLINFNNYKYNIEYLSLDLYKDNDINNIETEYEIKKRELGPIYKVEVRKKDNNE